MSTRPLTATEIDILESRACQAEDWSRVTVARDFTPGKSFHHVHFSGDVELGSFHGLLRSPAGLAAPAGVTYSLLYDVRIGNDCLIHRSQIARADIGDNVVLENVGNLSRLGDSSFANGSPAYVLAEDGARSVPLWRSLSAQLAHFLCHYRNHPAALALEEIVRQDAARLRLPRSVVSSGCRVRRSGTLRNVWLGEGASVVGAALLEDCYVASSRSAPTRIGEGVAARDCVFMAGSETDGGVRLRHCLVGEGVRLEDGFVAKHSLFFANSNFALGEASSALAGPFAVSTHKATLVLACQSSFATFGSGANSSNHHFKLGPRHGGVLRRGVRCGSGSYIFWPSDIGAFTTVVGRHTSHLDTVDFPFSLLVAKNETSVLVPGVNLFTSGMYRDAAKWLERDRRGNLANPRDLVNSAVLSPYVLQDMAAGAELLRRAAAVGADLRHGGAVIPSSRIEPALRLYDSALVFRLGELLLARAAESAAVASPSLEDVAQMIRAIAGAYPDPTGEKWRDWGGMLLPGAEAGGIVADLAAGAVADAERLQTRLAAVHAAYARHEWIWAAWRWTREYGEPTPESLAVFFEKWRRAAQFRHECFVKDASKEFSPEAMLGFGVEEDRATAFRRVRGTLAEHPLLARSEAERERLLVLAERAR